MADIRSLLAAALGGPSWLERAQSQAAADRTAYQAGGVPALMADTQGTQDLAGGFVGSTKGRIPYEPPVTASWILRNKETGEVIMETFDKAKVAALNTAKYEAVPIQEYLGAMNGGIK